MYIISRVFKFEKGKYTTIIEKFKHKGPLIHARGFIKRDVLLDEHQKDYDVLRIMIYWEDQKAYYAWEGSPDHIAMHKAQKEQPKVIDGLIEMYKESYTLVESHHYGS